MTTTPAFDNFSYIKLLALLPSYFERTDDAFKAKVPVFISLAENRLATDLKAQGFLTVAAGTFDIGKHLLKKPAYWRETVAFGYTDAKGEQKSLLLRPLEYVKAYWPKTTERDAPVYYADYNANYFYVAPTPVSAFPFELSFYARLNPLSPANDSNWMTVYMPQALFYACCLEAAIWSKNQAREATFQNHYNQAIGSLGAENQERLADRNVVVRRG